MQYRTDIKKVKALGTAKHGFGHWWMQRLSAVLMIPLGLWFVFSLMSMENLSPDTLIQWLYNPVPALLMALWTITVVYHAALGLQVIIEDYVHKKSITLALLLLVKFAMFTMIVATFFSLFKLVS
ncbi:MAG: succinate dehydrogenase, hydrophobic membrane anchor protein [Alcanivoracaceae bacterium]|nr:succinate dehydrogenase, hydrophobic membrane anchor protein [Alcanivoracaceae bacterium]